MTVSVQDPLQIGDVLIPGRAALASLAGYTDLAYRTICRRLDAPLTASEMMLDNSLLMHHKLRHRLAATDEDDHPVVGQIYGHHPARMARAAQVLSETGFDIIDLNFACPVRKALARKRGGYIMSEPQKALEITRAVLAAVDRPVTLKLRRCFGIDDSTDNFYRISEGAFDAGAAAICVHGRSVRQLYSGPADWEFLAQAKAHFPDRVLLGSGDVRTPQAGLEMLRTTGVDGVSAARGALGNPWFFQQIVDVEQGREPRRPCFAEQKAVIAEHYRLAVELYGPQRGSANMRKFGIKYARMHTRPKTVRMAFVGVETPQQWQTVLDEYYTDEYEQLGHVAPFIPPVEGEH